MRYFFFIALLLGTHAVVLAKVVDKIVAVVNKEPILESQINANQTLDNLIDDELIKQEIHKLGLDVSEAELEQTVQNILKQRSWTEKNLQSALAAQGMTLSSYKESLKKEMYKMKLIQNKVKNRVSSRIGSETRLDLEQASFNTKEEAEKAIQNSNIHFENLGSFSKNDLAPSLASEIFSLQENEISKPLKTPRGYIVVKVKKRSEISLEKVDKPRYEQELETAFKRYVKELRTLAYVKYIERK